MSVTQLVVLVVVVVLLFFWFKMRGKKAKMPESMPSGNEPMMSASASEEPSMPQDQNTNQTQ